MLHPSTQLLIDRLAQLTREGTIQWREGERTGIATFEAESHRITVSSTHLSLTADFGRELERAVAADLEDTPHPEHGTYAVALGLLARDAWRSAIGTEDAISAILSGLETGTSRDALAQASDDDAEAEGSHAGMRSAVARLADEVNQRAWPGAHLTAQAAPAKAPYLPFGLDRTPPDLSLPGDARAQGSQRASRADRSQKLTPLFPGEAPASEDDSEFPNLDRLEAEQAPEPRDAPYLDQDSQGSQGRAKPRFNPWS